MLFNCIGCLLNMTAHFLKTIVTSSLLHHIITFCPPTKHHIVMTHHVTLSSTITRVKHSWIISTHQKGYKIFRQLWIEQGLSKGLDTHTSVTTQIRGSVKTENLVQREKKIVNCLCSTLTKEILGSMKLWHSLRQSVCRSEQKRKMRKICHFLGGLVTLAKYGEHWPNFFRFRSAHQIEQKWAYGNKMKELVKVVSKHVHTCGYCPRYEGGTFKYNKPATTLSWQCRKLCKCTKPSPSQGHSND